MSSTLLLVLKSIYLGLKSCDLATTKEIRPRGILPRQGPKCDNSWIQIPWIWFWFTWKFEASSKWWRIACTKALMGAVRKEVVVGVTCWELKSHLFKALVLPTFTYDIELWGGNLKKLPLEGFWERHEDAYDISCQSVFFDNLSYFVGWIRRTSHKITHSRAHYRLSIMARPRILLLVG